MGFSDEIHHRRYTMTDTATSPAENFDGAESPVLVNIWKLSTIAGLVRRTDSLKFEHPVDEKLQMAVKILEEDIDDIASGNIPTDTETVDVFAVTSRVNALERYTETLSFVDLREALGENKISLLVPEEVDAGDYGVALSQAA